jgi:uncharacterized protein (DUF924 family)
LALATPQNIVAASSAAIKPTLFIELLPLLDSRRLFVFALGVRHISTENKPWEWPPADKISSAEINRLRTQETTMTSDAREKSWVNDVLQYWFGELTFDDWFTRKDQTDRAITKRFLSLYRTLLEAVPGEAYSDPRAALAAIIVLDQFPRNMFRGKADAFGTDDLALELARNALDREFDAGLEESMRHFLYMPFMHSEVLADQERCVSLFKSLGGGEGAKYAVEHRDIIARFGRFPHRNKALGRESTPDEQAFLSGHEGFGQ